MAKKGTLYIISAPSGTGKTSLVAALSQALPNLAISISHTTRSKREKEQSGIDYHFVTQGDFKDMISQGMFLEYAQVFGNFYGTSKQWVEETLQRGTDVILEIDWQGARQIRIQHIDAQSIFILPPSLDSLRERLINRHQDNLSIIEQRLKEARLELSKFIEYDYLICNDKFEVALEELKAIIEANNVTLRKQKENLAGTISKLIG